VTIRGLREAGGETRPLSGNVWPGVLACILLATFAVPSRAQTPLPPRTFADPSGVQQELQRQQQRLEQQTAPPKQQGPGVVGPGRATSPLLQPGGPKFALKGIVFDGESKFLSQEELDTATAPYVGRTIDFSDLQKIIAAINAIYEAKGVVTGIATLPPQDV